MHIPLLLESLNPNKSNNNKHPTKQQQQQRLHPRLPTILTLYSTLVLATAAILPSMASSLTSSSAAASTLLRRVVVVGGTHGNEYTGVWCIRALASPELKPPLSERYPALQIYTLLSNPKAHRANQRFVDVDLNREFSAEKLSQTLDVNTAPYEAKRAREIAAKLGPKSTAEEPHADVVIDLHTTTTNMGLTLIIPEGDVIMERAAAYVMHHCQQQQQSSCSSSNDDKSPQETHPVRCLLHTTKDRMQRPNLSSVGKHGFTIEVGPVPQGVLRHDAVETTQRALHYLLEFLQRRIGSNNHKKKKEEEEEEEEGGVAQLSQELQQAYPTKRVPCFRSAPLSKAHTTTNTNTNTQTNALSGRIPWPISQDNPNFPSVLVHKSIQDADFQIPIKTGDPLFVKMDGSVIAYDGSHGEEVYVMFVNEGGYYYESSGTGIGVAVKSEFVLQEEDGGDVGGEVVGGEMVQQSKAG